ncbi:MAG: hypothetical protein V3S29_05435 [bacterium]
MKNPKRFLPIRPRMGKKPLKLTRDQVSEAILAFMTGGGTIQKLPPQTVIHRAAIGNRWGAAYETVFERN